jgi:hypothetical protein
MVRSLACCCEAFRFESLPPITTRAPRRSSGHSALISDHADDLVRATLPVPAEVVPIDDRRASA